MSPLALLMRGKKYIFSHQSVTLFVLVAVFVFFTLMAVSLPATSAQYSMGDVDFSRSVPTTREPRSTNSTELTLDAAADTYVRYNYVDDDTNFGTSTELLVRDCSPCIVPDTASILLRFSLDDVPAGATINQAVLRLYKTPDDSDFGSDEPVDLSVFQVTESWGELSVTANNQPSIADEDSGTTSVGIEVGWYTWDVTDLVWDWVNDAASNYGLELRGPGSGIWWRSFSSRESTTNQPQLVVNYTFPQDETEAICGQYLNATGCWGGDPDVFVSCTGEVYYVSCCGYEAPIGSFYRVEDPNTFRSSAPICTEEYGYIFDFIHHYFTLDEQIASCEECDLVPQGCVRGHVSDANTGEDIPNVQISLWNEDDSEFYRTTNTNGNYEVTDMPPGTYQIWGIRDGYVDEEGPSLSVTGDGCANGDFQMRSIPMRLAWPIDQRDAPGAGITSWFDHEYPLRWYDGEPTSPARAPTTLVDFNGLCWGADCVPSRPSRPYSGHEGIDVALAAYPPIGSVSVLAAASGTVVHTETLDEGTGFGYHIVIDHGNDFFTLYGHLDKITRGITRGGHVNAGQEIGRAGHTGNTYPDDERGTHLHFGVYNYSGPELRGVPPNDSVVDPCGWLPRDQQDPWEAYGSGHPRSQALLARCTPQTMVTRVQSASNFTSRTGNVTLEIPAGVGTEPLLLRHVPIPAGGVEQGKGHDGGPSDSAPPVFPEQLVRVGPSFTLSAHTFQEEAVARLNKPIRLNMDFTLPNPSNVQQESIQVYRWDSNQNNWTRVQTSLDFASTTATVEIVDLGWFVLLARHKRLPIYLPLVARNSGPANLLFFDDFSDPSSGWPHTPEDERDGVTDRFYENGEYHIVAGRASADLGQIYYARRDQEFSDFDVRVKIRALTASSLSDASSEVKATAPLVRQESLALPEGTLNVDFNGAYGLFFRVGPNGYYFFGVSPWNGQYGLYKNVNSEWIRIQKWTVSPHVNRGASVNELRVVAEGTNITVYANKHRLLNVADDLSGRGEFWLAAMNQDLSEVHAVFDDFAVYDLEGLPDSSKVAP